MPLPLAGDELLVSICSCEIVVRERRTCELRECALKMVCFASLLHDDRRTFVILGSREINTENE